MAVERVIIEITGDTTKIQSTINELEKLGKVDRANSDSFKKTNQQFNDNLNKTKNSLGGFGDQLNSLKQQVVGAFAVSSLIAFGKEAVATAAKMQSITNSINIISGSSRKGAEAMEYLRSLSERLGLEFESTADAFRSFAGATLKSGMTMSQTQKIFTQASMAITTMGLSSADASLALQAMSQIAGKGVASMEELRQQLGERIPGVLQLTAEKMGYTLAEFNKLVSSGQILSKDILPAIGNALEEIGQGADAAAQGMQGNLNKLQNMWTDFKNFIGAYVIYPLIVGFKEFFIETPKKAYDEFTRLFNLFKKKTVFDIDPKLGQSLENAQAQFIKFNVQLENAKTKESVKKIQDALFDFYKTLEQPVKDAVYNNYIDAIDKINERTKSLPSVAESASAKLDAIIAKFKEFGEKAKTANTKNEITNIGRAVRDYYSSLEKGVKPEVKKYYYEVLDALKLQNIELVKASKQLNAYEDLVRSARDLEEAMRVTLAEDKIISPEAIKQLDDFKFQIDYIERALKNLNNPELRNINVGSSADKVPIKKLEETQLPPGDYGEAAYKAEIDALYALQEEYWKDQEEFKKAQEEKTRIAKEEADKRKAAEEEFYNRLPQYASQAIGIIAQYQQQSSQYELTLLDEKLKAKQISEKEYEKERRKILTKQAQDQKAAALLQATIDIAGSIMSTLKQFGGTPYGIAMAAITAGLGAAQLAVIQSQKIPKFKKGTDYVSLNGNPKGEDTIPALLNEGEAVITTQQNAKYPGLAKAWNDGKLDEHIYSKWMTPELILKKSLEREAIDYDRLGQSVADSIKKNPQVKVSFDKSGFATYIIKGNSVINYQNNRYSSQ